MSIHETLLAHFEAEARSTRAVLEAVPEDRLDWTPHAKSMTLGALAGHVAETPRWLGSVLETGFDLAAREHAGFVPTSRAELLARFEEGVAAMTRLLAETDDAYLAEPWILRAGEQVMFEEPRHEAIRTIAVHHVIHHRGQLTVYLRLLGVPVPSTYGPTADTPM